ncbi:unnamed protein product [Pieris macdunnoughi]|uniref:Uncharacterized protein n=1 Tax=Pieris macdunnoughi TaxID=345717 RepID=A0A821SLK6_9NEOP|nr:unnamed protein product [Pieris macdunnoughi]
MAFPWHRYDLTQLVPAITRLPDVDGYKLPLLDLLLTSHPENNQVSVDTPLGLSDQCGVRSTVLTTRPPRHATPISPPYLTLRPSFGKRLVCPTSGNRASLAKAYQGNFYHPFTPAQEG